MIKRLIPDADYKSFIDAANSYVKKLDKLGYDYLYLKPFDHMPFSKQYFIEMYGALNLIETLHIKPYGKVLEVGCGTGWVTEILASLGFHVFALEPSKDFVNIAKEKLESLSNHLHYNAKSNVEFFNTTMEESAFEENSFDAIIYLASLHHIVDEDICIEKSFKYLKPGGMLGIGQEVCYDPDLPLRMLAYEDEIKRSGVLENPFTKEYLDCLLNKYGFAEIIRYKQANGLFPVGQEATLNTLCGENTLTAVKPYDKKTTLDPNAKVKAEITVLDKHIDKSVSVLTLRVKNKGEAVWLFNPYHEKGYVTIALFDGVTGKKNFREALNRINLPRDIEPGEEFEIRTVFSINNPVDVKVDLINEGYYWFSAK
jgi:ubiquinone/menaquinone biosynthesis C-methylase UbiE